MISVGYVVVGNWVAKAWSPKVCTGLVPATPVESLINMRGICVHSIQRMRPGVQDRKIKSPRKCSNEPNERLWAGRPEESSANPSKDVRQMPGRSL